MIPCDCIHEKNVKVSNHILKYVKSNRWPRKIEIKNKIADQDCLWESKREMVLSKSSKKDFDFICKIKNIRNRMRNTNNFNAR